MLLDLLFLVRASALFSPEQMAFKAQEVGHAAGNSSESSAVQGVALVQPDVRMLTPALSGPTRPRSLSNIMALNTVCCSLTF